MTYSIIKTNVASFCQMDFEHFDKNAVLVYLFETVQKISDIRVKFILFNLQCFRVILTSLCNHYSIFKEYICNHNSCNIPRGRVMASREALPSRNDHGSSTVVQDSLYSFIHQRRHTEKGKPIFASRF